MSKGLAVACDSDVPDTLYERADTALYQSKSAGRNCLRTVYPNGASPDDGAETDTLSADSPITSYEAFKASFEQQQPS